MDNQSLNTGLSQADTSAPAAASGANFASDAAPPEADVSASASTPGGNLALDAATLQSNTLTLGAAAGAYLMDPSSDDNRSSFINAIAGETTNIAAVLADLNEVIQESPEAAEISRVTGITGAIASGVALETDGSALIEQINRGTVQTSTVISVIGDFATFAATGGRVGVEVAAELALLPEEGAIAGLAAGIAGVYGASVVFGGSALSALGSVLAYKEQQDGTDIIVTANSITYSNGLKGSWSDDGDDGNSNPTQSTYQTWDPSTGQVVGSITVPYADKQSLSQDGMIITAGSQQEVVGADGSLTYIDGSSVSSEASGTQRVFTADGSSYDQTSQDAPVDIGDGPAGAQQVSFNGTTTLPYQASVAADTSGTNPGSQASIIIDGSSSGGTISSQTQTYNGLTGQTTLTSDSEGQVLQTAVSVGGFSVSQSSGLLSLGQDGQGGFTLQSSSSSTDTSSVIASAQQSGADLQIQGTDLSASYTQPTTVDNPVLMINGNGNAVQFGDSSTISVTNDGSGSNGSDSDSLVGTEGSISLGSSDSSVTVTGNFNGVDDAPGVTGGEVTFNSSLNYGDITDGQINLGANNLYVTVDASNDTVYGGSYTGDDIGLGTNETDYVYGNNEIINGQSGDNIVDYGSDNSIYADGASVTDEGNGDMTYGNDDTIYGNGTGDGFNGTGDIGGTGYTGGGGPTGGTGGTGGTTYYGSSGFDAGTRQSKVNTISSYDQNQGYTKAAAAADASWSRTAQVIKAATVPGTTTPSALATARWGSSTVTWSFSDGPKSGPDPISGSLQSEYQVAVAQAFQTWAAASGITFKEVADGAKSDITIGWGELDPSASGLLGYTDASVRSGVLQPGATIRLEDPSQDALIAGSNGSYTYDGTTTTLEQLVLHEIGHTLGLAESSNPNSIMFPELSSTNTMLSSSDINNVAILYPQYGAVASASTTAMAQAMASFSAQEPAVSAANADVYAKTFQPAIAIPAS